jgi:hypothetical protein
VTEKVGLDDPKWLGSKPSISIHTPKLTTFARARKGTRKSFFSQVNRGGRYQNVPAFKLNIIAARFPGTQKAKSKEKKVTPTQ